MRRWLYFQRLAFGASSHRLLVALGYGHECVVDDPADPDYPGFTAGICRKRGIHRGVREEASR